MRLKSLVKCILRQIRKLLRLKTKLNKRKSGQTYKNIHKHVLQGHLDVLESSRKSHCSVDPKNTTKDNSDFFDKIEDSQSKSGFTALSPPHCYYS